MKADDFLFGTYCVSGAPGRNAMPHVWDADTQRVIAGNSSEDSPAAPTELAQIAATPLENRNESASEITNQRRHHRHLSQRQCRLQDCYKDGGVGDRGSCRS